MVDSGNQPWLTRDSPIFEKEPGLQITENTTHEYNEIIDKIKDMEVHEEIGDRVDVAEENLVEIDSMEEPNEEYSSSNGTDSNSSYVSCEEAKDVELSYVKSYDFKFNISMNTNQTMLKMLMVPDNQAKALTSVQI